MIETAIFDQAINRSASAIFEFIFIGHFIVHNDNAHDGLAKRRRLKLQGHLGILFSTLMLITGLTLTVIGYHMVAKTATSATNGLTATISHTVMSETVRLIRQPSQLFVEVVSKSRLVESHTLEERLAFLPAAQAVLRVISTLDSVYAGYDNGDFFMIRPLDSDAERRFFKAPAEATIMVRNIERQGPASQAEHLFFDGRLTLLARQTVNAENYDPRTRTWYQDAMKTDGQIETPPYLFFSSKQIGTTYAEKNGTGSAVAGIDITLDQLSEVLARELPTPGSRLVLFRPNGTLIATTEGMIDDRDQNSRIRTVADLDPIIRDGISAYLEGMRGQTMAADESREKWILSFIELKLDGRIRNVLLLAIPQAEILAEAKVFLYYTILSMIGILIFSMPFIWIAARYISNPLHALAAKAQRIQEFHLEDDKNVISSVAEIYTLAEGMNRMQKNLRNFLSITQAIHAERNFTLLLRHVLQEIMSVTEVSGGLLALLDDKRTRFHDGSACWLNADGKNPQVFPLEFTKTGLENVLPTAQAFRQNKIIKINIAREDIRSQAPYLASGFADSEVTQIEIVCVPLCDRMDEHLGILSLFKALKPGTVGFQTAQIAFIRAIASTAAIALENQKLINAQRDLRDAIIHILAGAIDAKSPYTGGHCQRVPIIFKMLLTAACAADKGPLRDFALDEDEWEEAKLAGWLHDCGKVTTPEYVVDKATKLETLYDRIHEIRTRFEVLKRDAENACLRALLDGADEKTEQEKLARELRELDDDFAFVASCNIGGESMDDAAIERLNRIGQRTWLRTLDKRLGVSREERVRMDRMPVENLPVLEPLLIDSPEHVVERTENDIIPVDNPLNFKLTSPSALYNRGELYNLSIRRGTLNEEERYKINDHITQTIIMLNQLPLPGHLANVPEIAGAHHETMDGVGFPRGLTRDQMSWSARMLAIADIFEALTASDRPYKSSKTLSESLKIMDAFKERNHIDPDLYALFLEAKIPQQYAELYLRPEQNDL